jgi:hypothetical protein
MHSMRSAYAVVSVAIAGYFSTSLGFDAARILASPLYGLEQLKRSEPIFAVGRLIGLEPGGFFGFAACLGAFELATTAVLVVYLLERLAGDEWLKAAHQTLEAALILVAILSATALGAALPRLDGGSIRVSAIHLALVGIAILLAVMERRDANDQAGATAAKAPAETAPGWHDPSAEGWFAI